MEIQNNTDNSPEEKPVKPRGKDSEAQKRARKAYYWRHKERILAEHREWREKNAEKLKAMKRAYNEKYKEKRALEKKILENFLINEEVEEDIITNRLVEMAMIADFYAQLGIKRPIDFAPTPR
jgi:hypothetical protein